MTGYNDGDEYQTVVVEPVVVEPVVVEPVWLTQKTVWLIVGTFSPPLSGDTRSLSNVADGE